MSDPKPKQEVDISIFYLCVHKRLFERTNPTRILNKSEFNDIMGRVYHLPKKLWICVMKEMIEMDMIVDLGIKKESKILVRPLFMDPEEKANVLYQKMGVF